MLTGQFCGTNFVYYNVINELRGQCGHGTHAIVMTLSLCNTVSKIAYNDVTHDNFCLFNSL